MVNWGGRLPQVDRACLSRDCVDPRRVPRSVQITITFRFGKPTVPNTLPPMRARMKGLSGSYTTGFPLRGNIEQACHKERIERSVLP